ncbi:uncharacterized protein [Struthio camelus]|uniref:uncharacterized protein n=1 Tax=Struthio camelus TaxID=8801 RepID=UPI003603EB25
MDRSLTRCSDLKFQQSFQVDVTQQERKQGKVTHTTPGFKQTLAIQRRLKEYMPGGPKTLVAGEEWHRRGVMLGHRRCDFMLFKNPLQPSGVFGTSESKVQAKGHTPWVAALYTLPPSSQEQLHCSNTPERLTHSFVRQILSAALKHRALVGSAVAEAVSAVSKCDGRRPAAGWPRKLELMGCQFHAIAALPSTPVQQNLALIAVGEVS